MYYNRLLEHSKYIQNKFSFLISSSIYTVYNSITVPQFQSTDYIVSNHINLPGKMKVSSSKQQT